MSSDRMPDGTLLVRRVRSLADLRPLTYLVMKKDSGDILSAFLCCPNGHRASLSDHEISEHGVVTPSVMCPDNRCNFHEHLTLDDWPWQVKVTPDGSA